MRARRKSKASLTLEAMISAIVLISLVITIYSLSNISNVYTKMQLALNDSATYAASLSAYKTSNDTDVSAQIKKFIIDSHKADVDYNYDEDFIKPFTDDEKADLNYLMSNIDALVYYTILLENPNNIIDNNSVAIDRIVKGWLLVNYSNCDDVDTALQKMHTSLDDIDTSKSNISNDQITFCVTINYKIISPIPLIPSLNLNIKSVATKW